MFLLNYMEASIAFISLKKVPFQYKRHKSCTWCLLDDIGISLALVGSSQFPMTILLCEIIHAVYGVKIRIIVGNIVFYGLFVRAL